MASAQAPTQSLFSVQRKTVLITGGTRGIGLMVAKGYLRAGARVYVSSRKPDVCEQVEQELAPLGHVKALPCDVSSEEQCRALIDTLAEQEPELDILVNNAGTTWGAPFDEFPTGAFEKVLALNVTAPFVLARLARPLLQAGSRPADPARILNIGSIDGLIVPALENYSYSASKAALHQLTRHLAVALAPEILVNAIAPGPFPSKMMAKTLQEKGGAIAAASPVGRIGTDDDVAAAAIYLTSRASNFMTGAVIPLDGGLSTTAGIHI